MPKLTRSRLAQVEEVLDASLFTSAAFDVESTDTNDDVVLIRYRDDKKFVARLFYAQRAARSHEERMLSMMGGRERVLWFEFCPGGFVEVEREEGVSFDRFLAEVRSWTDRLRSEIILVDTFQRQFREFQKELNRKLEEHFADATAHFTEDEKTEVFDRLRDFQERIEELEKTKQATEAQLEQLKQVIADLSRAATSLPKKAWYRTACSKLFEVGSKIVSSKAGQKVIETTIDRLLEAPKNG
jgi:hypothetical protein